jgi:hypothetical protein
MYTIYRTNRIAYTIEGVKYNDSRQYDTILFISHFGFLLKLIRLKKTSLLTYHLSELIIN